MMLGGLVLSILLHAATAEPCENCEVCRTDDDCAATHECRILHKLPQKQCVKRLRCPFGFESGAGLCDDLNGCLHSRLHNCDRTGNCPSLEGSYKLCKCASGYQRDSSTKKCENIDECLNSDLCPPPAYCSDTVGSFECTCPSSLYTLRYDTVEREIPKTFFRCHDKASLKVGNLTAVSSKMVKTNQNTYIVIGIIGTATLLITGVFICFHVRRGNSTNPGSLPEDANGEEHLDIEAPRDDREPIYEFLEYVADPHGEEVSEYSAEPHDEEGSETKYH